MMAVSIKYRHFSQILTAASVQLSILASMLFLFFKVCKKCVYKCKKCLRY
jgi:hypothetical protein